jgi:hypothetical protein
LGIIDTSVHGREYVRATTKVPANIAVEEPLDRDKWLKATLVEAAWAASRIGFLRKTQYGTI